MRSAFIFASSVVMFFGASSASYSADYNYTCPSDSNTCSYLNNTGETGKVSGGGGKTADTSAQINAPSGKYLVNMTVHIESQNGIRPRCEIEKTSGAQTINIQGIDITVYKSVIVRAHAETGSGAQAEGRTAHMQCKFNAKVVDKPQ